MESRSRRLKRTACFLMLFTAGALGISSAQALTLNPPTYSIAFSGIPGAVDSSGAVPQSGTYFYNAGTLDVSAAAATTAQPGVSAGVGSGGCTSGYPGSGCAGGGIGDSAKVVYQVATIGPPGVEVPYFVNTGGGIIALNTVAGGSAQVDLSGPGAGFTASTTLAGDGSVRCGANGCIISTQYVFLLSNTAYTVTVSASAGADTNFDGNITAEADPYFYIDSAFVGGDQFTLLISAGIGNSPLVTTPVPAALPTFATGLGALGLLGWRRKKKAAPLNA